MFFGAFNLFLFLLFFSIQLTGTPLAIGSTDPSLVGLWHMDGDWTDASGNGNNGAAYNGATFSTEGRVGSRSGSFDGVNDYVSIPNSSTLNPADQITVAAWYKPQSFSGSGTDPIIDKAYTSHASPYYQYHLGVTGDQYTSSPAKFIFNVAAGGVSYSVSTPQGFWTPGYWYHIVGTYDGTTVKLHVNGELVSSVSASGQMVNYGSAVYIGRFKNLTKYLPGLIDEVAIYNRALTTGEILDRYNDALPLVSIISPAPGRTNNQTPLLNYSVSAGAVTVKVDGGIVSKASGSNLDLLSDGTHTVRVEAVNSSGNTGYAEAAFTVDTVPPAVSIAPVMSPTRFSSQTIMGTRELDSTVAVSINTSALVGPVTYPTPETWSCPITNIPNTTNIISVSARDAAGNDGFTQETFIADAVLPSITIDPVTTLITNNTATITGTMENGATVTVGLDTSASVGPISYPTPTTWSSVITSLATGTTFVTATATNAQGNTATATATIHNNLVGLWHMDGAWTDASGNNNNGTAYNGATFSTDTRVGSQSGSFDGTNDYVSLANVSSLRPAYFSIEAWIKASSSISSSGAILSSWESQYAGFIYYISNEGNIVLDIADYSGHRNHATTTTGGYNDNTWHHVVGTYDGSYMRVYVDGAEKGNLAWTYSPGYTSSNIVMIGVRSLTSTKDLYFKGLIDEVAIYNRALTSEEINKSYNAGLVRVARWRMNGDWLDNTGNNHYGTAQNGAAFNNDAREGTQAGYFDGVDDLVTGNASGFPAGSMPRALSAWVKITNASQERSIIAYGDASGTSYQLLLDADDKAAARIGAENISGTGSLRDNKWHHLVALYEGGETNTLKLYVDGLLENTGIVTLASTSAITFSIGASLTGGSSFNGLIDDIAVYNRAISANEVMKLYSDGLGRVGLWHMDGDRNDASGNNNNGTAYNGATFSTDARVGSQSGSFDGTNDYISLANVSSLRPAFFSVEAWIKATPFRTTGHSIFSSWDPQYAGFIFAITTEGEIKLDIADFAGHRNIAITTESYDDNTWHHVAGTYDGSCIRVYVDGVEKGNLAWTYSPGYSTSNKASIGARSLSSTSDTYFNGLIDEVAMYNRALTADEIMGHYTAIVPYISISSPVSGAANNNTPLLNYTVLNGAATSVKLDGNIVNKVSGDRFDLISDGTHTVQVEAVGSSGKIGMARTTFTVDTVPPTLSINPVTSPTNTTSQTITGTVSGASSVTVSVDTAAAVGPVSYPTSNTWKSTMTNMVWGPNVITATTTDSAGNSATATATINQYRVGISNVAASSNVLDPSGPNSVAIFFTIDSPSTMKLKIIPEKEGPSGTPVYQASQNCPAGGAYFFTWDGKKHDGQTVPDEAYLYILEAENDGITTGRYSPEATGSSETFSISPPGDFDPFRNNNASLNYNVSAFSRVTIRVSIPYSWWKNIAGYPAWVYNIVVNVPIAPGNYSAEWDGRSRDGKIIVHPNMYPPVPMSYTYTVTPLRENCIITRSAALNIINVKIDPYYINLSYGEITKIKYTLSANANVTITLIPPTGTAITLLNGEAQLAGDHDVNWNGLDLTDATAKRCLISKEGNYTVKIQAVPATGTSSTVYRNLQIGF